MFLAVKIFHRDLEFLADVLDNLTANIVAFIVASNKINNGATINDFKEHPVRTLAPSCGFNYAILGKAGP